MGTFGSFTTVRLGIYAAQKGLDVTGNNITNINTEGYTRQRLNQVSLIASVNDRYSSSYNARVGQGAVIAGINQIRDPGLDISFRKANSDVGAANAKLEGLNQLATILDEVGKGSLDQDDGVILSQLNDIRDLISQAITNGVDTYDPLIRSSAEALCTLFNSYADKLSELQKTYEDKLDQQVDEVNDILTQIRDLNESIRNADLRGDPGLELRDQRNNLLDKLSGYMKIDVTYSMEDVGADTKVEKLTVTLATGDKQTLVDGVYGAQFSLDDQLLVRNPNFNPNKNLSSTNRPYLDANGNQVTAEDKAAKSENSNYTLVLGPLLDGNGEKKNATDFGSDIGDTELYGSIQSIREILTEKGEFATTATDITALRTQYETTLTKEKDDVNTLLQNIHTCNTNIKNGTDVDANIAERQKLLDQLNSYVGIETTTTTDNNISVTLAGNPSVVLVDSQAGTFAQFDVVSPNPPTSNKYEISVTPAGSAPSITLADDDLSGSIQFLRDELNAPVPQADTTIDPNAAVKRGIPYYQMMLDNLAYEFANQMNALNNTGLEGSGNLFSMGSDTNDAAVYIDPTNPEAGEIERITASNISVSKGWANQTISIQAKGDANAPSGDTSQLAEFLDLFSKGFEFDPSDINAAAGGDPYKGTFEDMLLKIQSTLAEDQMSTDAVLNNYTVTANDIYVDRDGVTGVDLNDEAAGLMTYQKAYTAACRLMNVLNEALDSLINGTV